MNAPVRLPRNNPLRALGYRAYAYLWLGSLVSNVGTWMETIAVGVHVTHTTGKGGWTGTVAALAFIPAVVLGPLSGALADRIERRRYLVVISLAQALVAAALAGLAFTDLLTLPAIVVLMTLAGCAATLMNPAFSALLANTVPEDTLTSAMTLNSAQFNLARITGPAIATAIVAASGVAWAFGFNALSFLAVMAAVMLAVRPGQALPRPREPLLAGIREGLQVARNDPGIMGALWMTLATTVLISPFIGLVPVMAIKVFGLGAAETSLLVTCQGVGAVVSAVASATVADVFGRRRLVEGAAWIIGPLTALYWAAPTYATALPAIAVLGAMYLAVSTGLHTVCLGRAPRHAQARVSALFSMVLGGGYTLGLMAMGWLGDHFGIRQVGVVACGLFVAALFAQRAFWPDMFEAMEAPSPVLGVATVSDGAPEHKPG